MNRNEVEKRLSSYGDFLLRQQMVAPGKEKFFIIWLRRYFTQEPYFKGQTWEDKLPQYLDLLSKDAKIAPWQVDQAAQAIRLYFFNFYARQKQSAKGVDRGVAGNNAARFDDRQALADLREWMRIKHYAYKTEQTYLSWCKRFFIYCNIKLNIKKGYFNEQRRYCFSREN